MPENTEPQAGTETTEPKPPWGDDPEMYDPHKAWAKMQALEADKKKLQARPVLSDEQQRQLDEYNRLVAASRTELEQKTEEVTRWQTEAQRWRATSVSNRIEALAGQDFADPSDAAAALPDPSKYIDAGGVIDEAAIKADLASVLDKKPHWRRQEPASGPRAPFPNPAQGVGGTHTPSKEAAFASLLQGQLKGS